jgi:hypothetical protein
LNPKIPEAHVLRDAPGEPPDGSSFLQRIEQRQPRQEETMKARGTNGALCVRSAALTCLCAGFVAIAALDSPAAFAAGKREVGHGVSSLPSKGNIPARFPTLPTGPHPSEAKSAQKITKQQL